jgi:hypothetical protein
MDTTSWARGVVCWSYAPPIDRTPLPKHLGLYMICIRQNCPSRCSPLSPNPRIPCPRNDRCTCPDSVLSCKWRYAGELHHPKQGRFCRVLGADYRKRAARSWIIEISNAYSALKPQTSQARTTVHPPIGRPCHRNVEFIPHLTPKIRVCRV